MIWLWLRRERDSTLLDMDIEMRAENESGKESRAKIDNDQIEARKDEIRKVCIELFHIMIIRNIRTYVLSLIC